MGSLTDDNYEWKTGKKKVNDLDGKRMGKKRTVKEERVEAGNSRKERTTNLTISQL